MLDALLLTLASAAFATEVRAAGTWPDSERVRERADRLCEAELAAGKSAG